MLQFGAKEGEKRGKERELKADMPRPKLTSFAGNALRRKGGKKGSKAARTVILNRSRRSRGRKGQERESKEITSSALQKRGEVGGGRRRSFNIGSVREERRGGRRVEGRRKKGGQGLSAQG